MHVESAGEASHILSAIRLAAEDKEHADKVSVLSIPCGSGKSTALTRLIHEVLTRDDGNWLIIVTDSIDRMDESIPIVALPQLTSTRASTPYTQITGIW